MTHSDNIKEGYFNKRINRFRTMGKVKKFKKYRNRFINGKLVCESREVDLSKQSLSRIVKREFGKPYNYFSALPFPVNEVSKIVGVVRRKNVPLRYVPNYEPEFLVKDILTRNNESFREYCNDKNGMVLPGAWKFSSFNLINMCTPNVHSYSIDQMIAGLKSRKDLELLLPVINDYDPESILGLGVNPKANPGFNTSKLFGRQRRRSVRYTKSSAYNLVMAMKGGKRVVDRSLVHIGGREKRNMYGMATKEAKTRVTCGQEDVPTLIGQSVVTPYNKSLQMMNDGFNWGGRINGRSNFKKLLERIDISGREEDLTNANTDFKNHDSDVDEAKIVLAFAVIRASFPICPFIDKVFFYCLSGMVFKRLVLPESGLVYEVTKGVLTGHAFTSIVTTISAYITLATSINLAIPRKDICDTALQGAGDDWITKLPTKYLSYLDYFINKFSGHSIDSLFDSSGRVTDMYPNRFPTFLKKHYLLGTIAWNVNELFTNLSYPTSSKMSLHNKIQNLMVMCVSGPFNLDINYCCKKLMIYHIIDLYTQGRHGYGMRSEFYNLIFEKVYKLLLYEKDIEVILQAVPEYLSFEFMNNLAGSNTGIDVRSICTMYIEELDRKVLRSQVWMLRKTHYVRHENVRRLKVFDVNKLFVPSTFSFVRENFVSELYK
jgi:hypothetical protein